MEDHKILSILKQSQNSLPSVPQKTMDPKFIVVLFCVETGALVFNSLHVRAAEVHLYNAYNQIPILHNISSKFYSCFTTVNHCIYEHEDLRFLKLIHLIFISIIVLCYFFLFFIILCKLENTKIRINLGITWYGAIQLLVLLTLALHTLIMVILYERDHLNIYKCNKESRLVRGENLFTYVVLSMLEVAYIGFDILNRQASIHALHQNFEYRARFAEHLAPSEDYNPMNAMHRRRCASTESFETVNQNFLSEVVEI
ncbi:unnamed protein product [Rotaria magnacalcarata]|uniref:Uncharacterized protein n=2 Tax=Rotaria magnacalcarata TaxID=392030 RepID=A0A816PEQ7_9BILA|nr:unnamed protein product [Rotaria magnacalcarata]CAF2048088.1 unnamed protein product [Rotaria magnacalcarata]CAF2050334.1 unnamed protein product [Rotaria magnacalcarata]CAF2169158.1 unnamed protein product [Rotaria magnacalcarata]CAF3882806.1 unnamed protein product [Rotaria magnacalcarata]